MAMLPRHCTQPARAVLDVLRGSTEDVLTAFTAHRAAWLLVLVNAVFYRFYLCGVNRVIRLIVILCEGSLA